MAVVGAERFSWDIENGMYEDEKRRKKTMVWIRRCAIHI